MSVTLFTSQKNALKRDDTSGTAFMNPPKTSSYSGNIYTETLTVPHNLGYVPMFRCFYEPFRDGVIWPAMSGRAQGNAVSPVTGVSGPGMMYWADITNLYIQLIYTTDALTAKYPVYWVIYRDFRLA